MLEPMDISPVEEVLYLALVDAPSLTTRELAAATASTEKAAFWVSHLGDGNSDLMYRALE